MRFNLNESNIAPQKNAIYVDMKTGKRYMWNGTKFVQLKPGQKPQQSKSKKQSQPQPNQQQDQQKDQKQNQQQDNQEDKKENKPQIGDRLSDEESKAEDEERAKAIKDAGGEIESEEEKKLRIERIKKLMNDPNYRDEVVRTTADKKANDKQKEDDFKYRNSEINRFKDSFEKFIKSQIMIRRYDSWSKINKKYSSSGLIKPGRARDTKGKAIEINVYFDQSGSWSDEDVQAGIKAVGVINNYVHRGEVVMHLKYFANNVHDNPEKARQEGGTEGQPILDDIKQTKPTNVVILTDSDIADCEETVEVPGGVWFLWKNGSSSNNLRNSLKGKETTKEFNIGM